MRGLERQALLLPTLVITTLFFVVPLGLIALYSFGSINQVNFDVYFGWTTQNYREFTSSLYVHTLLRSVVLSVSATLACGVLGFTFAYFISRQPPRAQRLLLVAVIVPFWTSFIVRTYSWVDLLQNLGPIDPALFDASADLGATPWRQFRRVVFPMALPGLIAGIIIVGVPALGEYVIPEILGGGKTFMAGNILADQFLETGNYPFGSALAVSVMVVLLLFLFLLRRAQPEADPR